MDDLGERARGRNTGEDWKWIGCTAESRLLFSKAAKLVRLVDVTKSWVFDSVSSVPVTRSRMTLSIFCTQKKKLSQSQTDVKLQRGTIALSSEGCRLHATLQAFSEVSEADGFMFIFITF